MVANEDIGRLEMELEDEKKEIRQDFTEIREKVGAARAELSPKKLIEKRLLLLSVAAFLLGFALGYRGVTVEEIGEIGKPAARGLLKTAGTQVGKTIGAKAAMNVFRRA